MIRRVKVKADADARALEEFEQAEQAARDRPQIGSVAYPFGR
jgi:hypothetical protein